MNTLQAWRKLYESGGDLNAAYGCDVFPFWWYSMKIMIVFLWFDMKRDRAIVSPALVVPPALPWEKCPDFPGHLCVCLRIWDLNLMSSLYRSPDFQVS
jgi:hypothetical protein